MTPLEMKIVKTVTYMMLTGGIGIVLMTGMAVWGIAHGIKPKPVHQTVEQRADNIRTGAVMMVENVLKDPGSAKFSGVRYVRRKNVEAVCGMVNARNGFGGFTGWQVFVVSGEGVIINSAPTWRRYCS